MADRRGKGVVEWRVLEWWGEERRFGREAAALFPLPSPVFQNTKRSAVLWVDPFPFPLTEDRSTNRVERARDAHRVGVKVAHRRFLKENDGIKGLILGAGGDTGFGQCGQKMFELLFARQMRWQD